MKDKILQLRAKGYTYNQIKEEIGCSKSTVCYYCGEEQRRKTNERSKKRRAKGKSKRDIISSKLTTFTTDRRMSRKNVYIKIRDFAKPGKPDSKIVDELLEILSENPICYLTGRKIDLSISSSYSFDHVIPISRGGESNMENFGLTCFEANMAKRNLEHMEFIELCKEVLKYHGYIIT